MGHVRFGFISKNYLRQHIVEDPFLRGDTFSKDLILKAVLEENETVVPKIKPRRYKEIADTLLVIGGRDKKAVSSLEYYDTRKKSWSEIVKISFNLCNFGLVAIKQKVYVLGVSGGNRSTVCCYDVNANKWEQINDMTTRRINPAVAVLNNCIYAMGGYHDDRYINSVERLDIQTRMWSSVAPMLNERGYFGAGVLNDTLYVVGGNTSRRVLKSTECYSHRTDTWKELSNMNHSRQGLGVCTLDGKLYAIGGYHKVYLSSVEEYDPDTDNWTIIAPMKVARAVFGVAVVNNIIYVTGGKNQDGTLNSVEVYDKVTNSWTILPHPMNVARSQHGTVIVGKTN